MHYFSFNETDIGTQNFPLKHFCGYKAHVYSTHHHTYGRSALAIVHNVHLSQSFLAVLHQRDEHQGHLDTPEQQDAFLANVIKIQDLFYESKGTKEIIKHDVDSLRLTLRNVANRHYIGPTESKYRSKLDRFFREGSTCIKSTYLVTIGYEEPQPEANPPTQDYVDSVDAEPEANNSENDEIDTGPSSGKHRLPQNSGNGRRIKKPRHISYPEHEPRLEDDERSNSVSLADAAGRRKGKQRRELVVVLPASLPIERPSKTPNVRGADTDADGRTTELNLSSRPIVKPVPTNGQQIEQSFEQETEAT